MGARLQSDPAFRAQACQEYSSGRPGRSNRAVPRPRRSPMPLARRFAAFALILVAAALAQTPPDARADDDERSHSLVPGAWALQFAIGDDFAVRSFAGTTISIKHHSSANSALRLGFSPSLNMI